VVGVVAVLIITGHLLAVVAVVQEVIARPQEHQVVEHPQKPH
jgi:hypothetical protein